MTNRDEASQVRVALGLWNPEAIHQTVEWADQLFFCNLTDADLSDMNLGGKEFVGCVLSGCSFDSATLDGVRFRTCVASGLPLSFEGASTVDLQVENCNFSVPDGAIHPVWEEFIDEILAAASGDSEDLLYEVCNPDHLDPDDEHEAAVFFAAQALHDRNPRLRMEAVECFGMILPGRPDVVGSALDALVALVALRAGDDDSYVYHEAFAAVAAMQPSPCAINLLCSSRRCPDRTLQLETLRGLRRLLARFDWGAPISHEGLVQTLVQVEQGGHEDALIATLELWYDRIWEVGVRDIEEASTLGNILTRLLRHPNSKVRLASLAALSGIAIWDGRDAIAVLLEDDDPEVRERAWQTLYEVTDPGADLRAFILEWPPSVRARETIALESACLRESGRPSRFGTVEELTRLATSSDPGVRRQGIYFLGLARDPSTSPILLAGLSDRDARVRLEATRAVAAAGIPDAVAAIEPLLTDSDEEVRTEAARAVERMLR